MIYFILAAAFVIRLISLTQSFWLDEATSITVANQTVSQIIEFSKGDFHPPFYYLVLHFWIGVFGSTETAARMLSIFFALGTIYLTYVIANKTFTQKAGYIAATLLAIAPLHVYYSQEARMYSQLTFFATLCVFAYISKKWWLFSASILLLVATDYVGALLIPIFFLHTIFVKDKLQFKRILLALVPLVGVTLLWLPHFSTQLNGGLSVQASSPQWWAVLGGSSIKQIVLFVVKLIVGRIDFDNNVIYGLAVSIPVLALCLLFWLYQNLISKKHQLFVLWFLIPTIFGILLSFFIPIFSYFRFLFVLPAIYIIISSLVNLKRPISIGILACFAITQVIFTSMYLFNQQFHREDWRGLVKVVQDLEATEVYFVSNSQMEAFKWYAKDLVKAVGPNEEIIEKDAIWVMRYVHDIFDPKDTLIQKVEALGYSSFTEYNFNGVVIRKYEKNSN